jgi:hypothetical protein
VSVLADDAVFVSSPSSSAQGATLRGKSEIRAAMQRDASSGAKVETSNFQVSGDTVTDSIRAFVDGRLVNAANLQLAREVFGGDHLLSGSDGPFPMGVLSPSTGPGTDSR